MGDSSSWVKTRLVIASIHVNYFNSILLNDEVEIRSKASSLGNKSLKMVQEIVKSGEEEPAAIGKTMLVCFDMPTRTSIEIPESWKEKINKFENS